MSFFRPYYTVIAILNLITLKSVIKCLCDQINNLQIYSRVIKCLYTVATCMLVAKIGPLFDRLHLQFLTT